MSDLYLEITTPSKNIYSGKIKSVKIPGTLGEFQVLKNHAPLLGSFEIGKIKYIDENGEETVYATSGGTAEIIKNKIIILAETAEKPEEIDAERARKAVNRARERLKAPATIDVDRAEAALARALNRLDIYDKYSNN